MSFIGDQAYLQQQVSTIAPKVGIDPQAALAVASQEGAGGGIGDNGTSFGPWQLHIGGALPTWVGQLGGSFAQQWAWSTEGIQYALQKMADSGARGQTGSEAIATIVSKFEIPADPQSEINRAVAWLRGQTGTTTTTTTTTTQGTIETGQQPTPSEGTPTGDVKCKQPTAEDIILPPPVIGYVLKWIQFWFCFIGVEIQRGIVMIIALILAIIGIWLFSKDREAPEVVKVPVQQTEKAGKKAGQAVQTAAVAAAA